MDKSRQMTDYILHPKLYNFVPWQRQS